MAKKYKRQLDIRVAPTTDTHAVRWIDMVNYVSGMTADATRLISLEPLNATYNPASMTLTASGNGGLVVDGVIVAVGDRITVAGQLDKTQNGIYIVTDEGDDQLPNARPWVLTRAADMDKSAAFKNGLIVPVEEGDDNANTVWKMTVGAIPFVLDSVTIEFEKSVTDITRVVEASVPIVGDGVTITFGYSHGWDTLKVTHELYENSTGDTVGCDFTRVNANQVAVTLLPAPEVGEDYTLIIRSEVEPA